MPLLDNPVYAAAEAAARRTRQSVFSRQKEGLLTSVLERIVMDLATLPARAGAVAQQYGETGEYNPAPIMEAALTTVTGGMPFAQAGALGSAGGKGIRAYHGSPHDFDKFDMSRIGTGEGAQAYGHGLYFAEKEATAKAYREKLGNPRDAMGASLKSDLPDIPSDLLQNTLSFAAAWPNRSAKNYLTVAYARNPEFRDWITKHGDEFERAIERGLAAAKTPGRMYEVNINAKPDEFLNWDKPLSQQPKAVQEITADLLKNPGRAAGFVADHDMWPVTGSNIYKGIAAKQPLGLMSGTPQDVRTSHMLRDAGIPGIKYLDQGSRAGSQGTSNYVLFRDNIIDILKKYGLIGSAMLPATDFFANESSP